MFHHRFTRLSTPLFLLLFIFFSLAIDITPVSAATIVVNTFDDENTPNAFCSLREATIAATNDIAHNGCDAGSGADTITLPAGTYTLSSYIFTLGGEIVINGADAGTTIVEASTCNPVTLPEGCTPADDHIFSLSSSSDLTLNNMTLRHGVGVYGGAIVVNTGGDLNITDSILSGNLADNGSGSGRGGAIYMYDGATAVISNSTVTGNKSLDSGGGIHNEGSLTLTNTIIQYNDLPTYGGGIYNNGTLEVSGGTISDNESKYGGGISNSGTANISECTISGNDTSSYGGGIDNKATVTLTDSTLSGNTASSGGGINNFIDDSVTLINCTLTGNEALTGDGGGIYNFRSENLYITNSTISGNIAADQGGGIYNYDCPDSTVHLLNVTLSNNSATTSGGGIYNDCLLDYVNTIIANSTGGDCHTTSPNGIDSGSTKNLVEVDDGSCSPDYTGDPMLGALADNSGKTHTHALLQGSNAIDNGDLAACPATDQRGVSRPQGDGCDIGAYEYEPYEYFYLPLILKQ